MTILDEIITYKAVEVRAEKQNAPLAALEALAREAGPVRPFKAALERKSAAGGTALIAEIKKASPSKGVIREHFMPEDHARAYGSGGATCLSVLTDGPSFQGNSKYLRVARAASTLPVLRKDFMIDPYQCTQARAWGADCILVIMACVSDQQANELVGAATAYHMHILVEVHDETELTRALTLIEGKSACTMIGVNNRNLATFKTRLDTTARLARLCPRDVFLVSESGISTHSDIAQLKAHGAKAFLVGETLMRKDDIEKATRTLINGPTVGIA
ncbi:MAG: indole-3-glycerol phosphate synthase TrpC [Pseudomonadota bacterium]